MTFCTPNCQKYTLLGFAGFFLVVGIVLVASIDAIVDSIKKHELNLGSNETIEYQLWKETPIPMYMDVYLWNWTNSKEVTDSNWTVKMKFQELGPYTYEEKHIRQNVVFNDNHTVSFNTQRIWHFLPNRTTGTLDDNVTTFNPVVAVVGALVKHKHSVVQIGANFFIEEKQVPLVVTKTVREFLFDGYDDVMVDLLAKLHLRHIKLPFTKFGWFSARNGSITYEGTYNMWDGTQDVRKLGKLYAWEFQHNQSEYYPGKCGIVGGTTGEVWYPVKDDESVEVFTSDVCSTITLEKNGTSELFGIRGNNYVATARTLDNGTLFPEMACFSPEEVLPTGVRNISKCKFGAPAVISLPHFYMADPFYREGVDGMNPDPVKHSIIATIESETGIPLQATVAAQINLRVEKINNIKLLQQVKTTYMPVMWFRNYATLDQTLANEAKLILRAPDIGHYTGYALIGLSGLLFALFAFVIWKQYRQGREEERLLPEEDTS